MAQHEWRRSIGVGVVTLALAAWVGGCGGKSSGTTGSTAGTATAAARVSGTVSKGPGVTVSLDPGTRRSWLARLSRIGVVEAAVGDPVVGAVVQLACSGSPLLTERTDARGKFEFHAVPTGTSCDLSVLVNGGAVPLATGIQILPSSPVVEVEGVITLRGTGPGLQKLEVETDVFENEDNNNRRRRRGHEGHTAEVRSDNSGPGSSRSGPGGGTSGSGGGSSDDDSHGGSSGSGSGGNKGPGGS